MSAYLKSWRRKSQVFEFFDLAIVSFSSFLPSVRRRRLCPWCFFCHKYPSKAPKTSNKCCIPWLEQFHRATCSQVFGLVISTLSNTTGSELLWWKADTGPDKSSSGMAFDSTFCLFQEFVDLDYPNYHLLHYTETDNRDFFQANWSF